MAQPPSAKEILHEEFKRPEEDVQFLRDHSPVYTIRVTGEFICESQLTIFSGDDGTIMYFQMMKEPLEDQLGKISRGRQVRKKEGYLRAETCPQLKELFDTIDTVMVDMGVGEKIYQPSVIYRIWSTSLFEERYVKFIAKNPAMRGSYWGQNEKRSVALEDWISQALEVAGLDPNRCSFKRPKCKVSMP